MNNNVVLMFTDGHKLEALLSRPFRSHENCVEVILNDDGKQHAFPLDELCCIGILGKPGPGGENPAEDWL